MSYQWELVDGGALNRTLSYALNRCPRSSLACGPKERGRGKGGSVGPVPGPAVHEVQGSRAWGRVYAPGPLVARLGLGGGERAPSAGTAVHGQLSAARARVWGGVHFCG